MPTCQHPCPHSKCETRACKCPKTSSFQGRPGVCMLRWMHLRGPLGPVPGFDGAWVQVEVACMLFECGTNVSIQNKDGATPLHLASQWSLLYCVSSAHPRPHLVLGLIRLQGPLSPLLGFDRAQGIPVFSPHSISMPSPSSQARDSSQHPHPRPKHKTVFSTPPHPHLVLGLIRLQGPLGPLLGFGRAQGILVFFPHSKCVDSTPTSNARRHLNTCPHLKHKGDDTLTLRLP
jgi:hypothetical protein